MIPATRTIFLAWTAATVLAWPSDASASDPTTADCVAASNDSLDLKNDRKLRAARAQLLVCSAASCPADIRKECLRRVEDINAQVPTILFEVKDASGNDLSRVTVTMDGEPLIERLEGTAVSLDPGTHSFMFETAGQAAVQREFTINAGQKDRRERITFGETVSQPVLKQPGIASAPPPANAGAVPPVGASSPPPAPPYALWSAQRVLGVVAGSLGVAGLAAGAVFGAQALSKRDEANQACPAQCPDWNGVNLWNDAVTTGNVATALLAAGAVGVVGGAVLWFTAAPPRAAWTARVELAPSSVQVSGAW